VRQRLGAWALWWVAFWWGFLLLAGDWNAIEWIAGSCVATVGATLAELLRASGRVPIGVSGAVLRRAPAALMRVPVDFGILTLSLLRRQTDGGRYVAREFEPHGQLHAAWTVLVAGYSPNAYVVDIDEERGVVLLHDLVPNRASERPA
jgi:hypothetical protein